MNHEMHRRMEMWYNTHVSMNGEMNISRQFVARVRYSAAYFTGVER